MYPLIRPLLSALPAEAAHRLGLGLLGTAERLRLMRLLCPPPPADPVELMGLRFANRVGLAAGLDKNGDYVDGLGALGFGFVELGTVTPRAQPGNPPPRLFRLPRARALINRMGFNNRGVAHLVGRAMRRRYVGVLGINIGKNAATPLEQAAGDYLHCLEAVYPLADYVAVNVSSPNTPGLRGLQGGPLDRLLRTLVARRDVLADQCERRVPLAVKIAPDLDKQSLDALADTLIERGIEAVIATNTTIDRSRVSGLPHGGEAGGLSGAPLIAPAAEICAALAERLRGVLPIIASGGLMSGADARARIAAGAALVQVYTGLIYRGPGLVAEIARALAAR